MQIKEVKIAGFQFKNWKITLTYQVYSDQSKENRYIIRENRKIITQWWNIRDSNDKMSAEIKAINSFSNRIYMRLKQTELNI